MWWWDGVRWVLANPAVMAPPPRGYSYVPPPYLHPPPGAARVAPRGLRVLLIVMLAIAAVLSGLMGLVGTIAVTGGDTGAVSISLWVLFLGIFGLSAAGLVGVILRSAWGRWVALAAGIAASFTCIGAIIGIPIIVAAARAAVGKPA